MCSISLSLSITFPPLFWSSVPLFPPFLLNLLPSISSRPSLSLGLFYVYLCVSLYLPVSVPSLSPSLSLSVVQNAALVCSVVRAGGVLGAGLSGGQRPGHAEL